MNIKKTFFLFIIMTLGAPAVLAEHFSANNISVEIVNDYDRELPTFPTRNRRHDNVIKSYVEAKPQNSYAIRVKNHSNERIAFVIAVDGRNIISGKKSKLRNNERKYVLEPYQQATYRGWRTSKNRINEFYFTDEEDSYSAAFGDYSAMGVIAVAAFRDADRHVYDQYEQYEDADGYSRGGRSNKSAPAPSASSRSEKRAGELSSQPGTGYGDERYSRSRRVQFNEEKYAAATFLLKYEWRETLCELGISQCYSRARKNRLWNDNLRSNRRGYAPPPRYRSSARVARF